MVRHYDPCRKFVSNAIKIQQRILNEQRNVGVLHPSHPCPFVKMIFNASAPLDFQILSFQMSQFDFPSLENRSRKRIRQTECKHLGDLSSVEMGKVASRMPASGCKRRMLHESRLIAQGSGQDARAPGLVHPKDRFRIVFVSNLVDWFTSLFAHVEPVRTVDHDAVNRANILVGMNHALWY